MFQHFCYHCEHFENKFSHSLIIRIPFVRNKPGIGYSPLSKRVKTWCKGGHAIKGARVDAPAFVLNVMRPQTIP